MLMGNNEPVAAAVEFNVTEHGGDNALSLGKLLRLGYRFDLNFQKNHLAM